MIIGRIICNRSVRIGGTTPEGEEKTRSAPSHACAKMRKSAEEPLINVPTNAENSH